MKKKRIIFVNLHSNDLIIRKLYILLFNSWSALKHRYFLDFLIENPHIEVCVYINKWGFSLSHHIHTRCLRYLLNLFRFMEYRFVMRKNGIDISQITLLKKEKEIRNDDIVLLYNYFPLQSFGMEKTDAFKAVSFLHYTTGGNTSQMLEQIKPHVFFNESNLFTFNQNFNKYFKWFNADNFITYPFVYGERFFPVKSFQHRENRAVSVGTITYISDPESKFSYVCLQPMRKFILENRDSLQKYIECCNFDNRMKYYSTYEKILYVIKRNKRKQKQYYSFDMVEKFNEFKMCIVGEEITGVPGIGFVEGMACGCAYIGLNNGLYEQYGLKEGVHYIGYDGTLSDLTEKIKYWQRPENQNKLEEIARTGCTYVREHFNKEAVASLLLTRLLDAHKVWRKEYLPESY